MTLSDLKGQVLEEKYVLKRRLGAGQFGTVYYATELLNGVAVRDVALKLFSPEMTRSGNVEGMLNDCAYPAQILASDAPHTIKRHFVQIYAFGRIETPVGECAYVAMELVKNAYTLENIMERNAAAGFFPDAQQVLGYMEQFFEGLELAHNAGVLHRDIKGANVMVQDGVLKIVDFGMSADATNPEASLKTTLRIYAPENFDGMYVKESDIFQAGLMFYEFWTNEYPMETGDVFTNTASDMQAAKLARLRYNYSPGGQIPGVSQSAKLEHILSKCLEKRPEGRYRNAGEVLADLRAQEGVALALYKAGVAIEKGDYDGAKSILLEAQTLPKDETQNIEYETMLGDCAFIQQIYDEALAHYLSAYRIADKSAQYFLEVGAFNALVDKVVQAYTSAGKKGMARIFLKNRR